MFSSVQSLSHVWFFATPWTIACQASLSITNSWNCSNSCPQSQWYHPTISSSVVPFSSCLQSFPASGFLQWVSSSPQVARVLELQLQHQSFQWLFRVDFLQDWLIWSPSKIAILKYFVSYRRCTVQEYEAHSHYCRTLPWNVFIFPGWNPIPTEQ